MATKVIHEIIHEEVSTISEPRMQANQNTQPAHSRKKPTKNEYKHRNSRLDTKAVKLDQSEYRGFFNMIIICFILVFVSLETQFIVYEGTLVGFQTVKSIFLRFDLLPAWLSLVSLSFTSYLLQKAIIIFHIPILLAKIIHYSFLAFVFGLSSAVTLARDWPVVQTSFFLAETLILLMKMQSYFATNMEYHAQMISGSKQKGTVEKDDNEKSIRYPTNVTLLNYLDFLLVPTLCYELSYPRTQKIRASYLLEKLAQFAGIWAGLHIIIHAYCLPIIWKLDELPILEAIGRLIFPFMLVYLLVFYIIFDVVCNGFAELTRFADREFYSDWWNSTTFDEFARNWNKPVHEWLLRHIYLESMNSYKVSNKSATLITFLLSSIVHEFFMSMLLRMFRPWLFFLQMFQLPLIFIGRKFKGTRYGNFGFWFGMLIGPPLLTVLYCREYLMQVP